MSNSNVVKKALSNKKKKAVSTKTSKVPNPTYSPRKNNQFEDIISNEDESRLITGTSTVTPTEASGESSLLVHQGKHALGVDLEANYDRHYGSISNNTLEASNDSYCYMLQNLTSTQLYLLVAVLALLVILTALLYSIGDTDQLKEIWNKIFCWLGVMNCNTNNVRKLE